MGVQQPRVSPCYCYICMCVCVCVCALLCCSSLLCSALRSIRCAVSSLLVILRVTLHRGYSHVCVCVRVCVCASVCLHACRPQYGLRYAMVAGTLGGDLANVAFGDD